MFRQALVALLRVIQATSVVLIPVTKWDKLMQLVGRMLTVKVARWRVSSALGDDAVRTIAAAHHSFTS